MSAETRANLSRADKFYTKTSLQISTGEENEKVLFSICGAKYQLKMDGKKNGSFLKTLSSQMMVHTNPISPNNNF